MQNDDMLGNSVFPHNRSIYQADRTLPSSSRHSDYIDATPAQQHRGGEHQAGVVRGSVFSVDSVAISLRPTTTTL